MSAPLALHPGLRTLLRLKLVGGLRRQWRRIRTPGGAILTIVGLLIFASWIGSIVAPQLVHAAEPVDPELLRPVVRIMALVLTVLSVSGALNHRGLYMPREEIERLLGSPVPRADLVRYRLLANSGRAAIGSAFLGLILVRRMPLPGLAFAGAFVALQTLPVLAQMAAVLAGGLEKRVVERFRRWRTFVAIAAGILLAGTIWLSLAGDLVPRGVSLDAEGLRAALGHPVLAVLTAPFEVWARAVTATEPLDALLWIAVSAGAWILLFEATARLPIDFRELSLETAASVAQRIRRMSRGGGASAGEVSRRAIAWRVPWLFGRGPTGAIAWRKTSAIVRRARGTLLVSAGVLAFVVFLSTVIVGGGGDEPPLAGPLLVVVLGLFYLAGGLRFDFREELEAMETIKSWPVAPWKVFLGMLLPEVLLLSLLLALAALVRAGIGGGVDPVLGAVLLALPLVALAWLCVDNGVFLLVPVRFVPGQEGALQNAGRSVLLFLLRAFVLGCLLGVAALAAWIAWLVARLLDAGPAAAGLLAFAAGWLALLVLTAATVLAGAALLRRFDVARDRG